MVICSSREVMMSELGMSEDEWDVVSEGELDAMRMSE